ncbi:MAG: hypothetical protein HY762_07805 [Planctomycetes bacterium]|nr:hypothetical protein [Planctomycetota bacterium]
MLNKLLILVSLLVISVSVMAEPLANQPIEPISPTPSASVPPQDIPAPEAQKPPPIMKLDDVRVGMKGYGKTVFEGTKIERFGIEVTAILRNTGPKTNRFLIRISHPVTDRANIVQGMSGSPVFVVTDPVNEPEGKLIGALSYGYSFCKEPIAGVTPIEEMIKDMGRPVEKPSFSRLPVKYDDTASSRLDTDNGISDGKSGILYPLKTPLFVSGMNADVVKYLEKELAPFNLYPVQSGGSGGLVEVNDPLEPGSAIGIPYVRGDIEWVGNGTVTYVDGNNLVAFGHKMDLAGETAWPMTTAYMYGVMPRLDLSFKIGVGSKEVGVISQDRQSCVVGIIGKKAPMFPMTVSIANPKTGFNESYKVEVVHHRDLTPILIGSVIASVMETNEPNQMLRSTVEVKMRVKFKGYEPITLSRLLAGEGGALAPVYVTTLYRIFRPIWQNPFMDEMGVEDVAIDISVVNDDRTAIIQNAWLEKDVLKPGEVGKLYIQLKPYPYGTDVNNEVVKTVQFFIPPETPEQDIQIAVAGGGDIAPELPDATKPLDIINYIKAFYEPDTLVTMIPFKSTALFYQGNNLKGLPNSVLSSLINQSREAVTLRNTGGLRTSLVERLELDAGAKKIFTPVEYIISGARSVRLLVRN